MSTGPGGPVGFWGTYIVARTDRPLPEFPALRPSAESVVWHGRDPGGWQAVQVHRGPDGWASPDLPARWEATLTALMAQAGHLVLAAVIMDSDGAQLIGYSPVAGRWGGWLMLDRIIGHIIPDAWPMIVSWDEDTGQPQLEAADGEDYQRRRQAALDRMHAVGPPAPVAAPLAVTYRPKPGSSRTPARSRPCWRLLTSSARTYSSGCLPLSAYRTSPARSRALK